MVLSNTVKLGHSVALQSAQVNWIDIGTIDKTTADADSALGNAERYYDAVSALANAVGYSVPFSLNGIEALFLLDVEDRTADIDVYAVRKLSNDLIFIATLDVVAGAQVNEDGLFFADTIVLSNHTNSWFKRLVSVGRGANYIQRFGGDFTGFDRILFHGYGTFDSDVIIRLSGH